VEAPEGGAAASGIGRDALGVEAEPLARADQHGASSIHFGREAGRARLHVHRHASRCVDRRWLSFDLLCGRVGKTHPWRTRLEAVGISPDHLDELATGEAKPDLIGINHYVTSDRFLDHRTSRYPRRTHGGNGRDRYADIEAARAELDPLTCGWEPRLREAWERYRMPIVVTEAHLGCEDECEQVRWLLRVWRAAEKLRGEGADIRAVTAWALFGLVDWDSLLCRRRNRYEPGAFDSAQNPPRPTLLAEAIRALADDGSYSHPALADLGWWEREDRMFPIRRRA
jgi:dTDP-4-dehydrorhamnose reductase